jgi:hypothetical protein
MSEFLTAECRTEMDVSSKVLAFKDLKVCGERIGLTVNGNR